MPSAYNQTCNAGGLGRTYSIREELRREPQARIAAALAALRGHPADLEQDAVEGNVTDLRVRRE
jgi:hypothetical protein